MVPTVQQDGVTKQTASVMEKYAQLCIFRPLNSIGLRTIGYFFDETRKNVNIHIQQ